VPLGAANDKRVDVSLSERITRSCRAKGQGPQLGAEANAQHEKLGNNQQMDKRVEQADPVSNTEPQSKGLQELEQQQEEEEGVGNVAQGQQQQHWEGGLGLDEQEVHNSCLPDMEGMHVKNDVCGMSAAATAVPAASAAASGCDGGADGCPSPQSSSLAHVSSDEGEQLEGEDEQTGPLPKFSYPLGELAPVGMRSRRSSSASHGTMRRHTLGTVPGGPAAAQRGRRSRTSSVSTVGLASGAEATAAAAASDEVQEGGVQLTRGRSSGVPQCSQARVRHSSAAATQPSSTSGGAGVLDKGHRRRSRPTSTAAAPGCPQQEEICSKQGERIKAMTVIAGGVKLPPHVAGGGMLQCRYQYVGLHDSQLV
jgi:hypothetical protein